MSWRCNYGVVQAAAGASGPSVEADDESSDSVEDSEEEYARRACDIPPRPAARRPPPGQLVGQVPLPGALTDRQVFKHPHPDESSDTEDDNDPKLGPPASKRPRQKAS